MVDGAVIRDYKELSILDTVREVSGFCDQNVCIYDAWSKIYETTKKCASSGSSDVDKCGGWWDEVVYSSSVVGDSGKLLYMKRKNIIKVHQSFTC